MCQQFRVFKMKKYVTAILLVILFRGCLSKAASVPYASKGILNLKNWNFDKAGSVKLDGQWELYWGQLLTPKDFSVNPSLTTNKYIGIPGALISSTNKLSKQGYGTIRLKIKTNDNLINEIQYGIRTEYILSASKIWVNGVLVSSVGVVGKNANNSVESYERQLIFFGNKGNDIEIVIQMSNFNNITGKIKSIYLGSNKQIKRDYIKSVALDAFIIGCLFIMGIYHFILYYKRRKYKAPLYFGIFCLLAAARNILVSQRLIFEIFPNISFGIFNKMAYLTVYLSVPFIVMFFKEIFGEKIPAKIVELLKIISIVISIVTILFNIEFYDKFLKFYEISVILVFVYILLIIVKIAINKNQSAFIILIGLIVFLITVIHDMLIQSGLVFTTSLAPSGLVFFVFLQSYMLAAEFSKAYADKEKLVEENKAMFIDELTGILNRKGFYEHGSKLFEAAQITGSRFAIFYGDLNKFKNINDSFGHKEGDIALITTAQIIKNSFGKDDIVARMSGDEFTVIAVNKSLDEAKDVLKLVINNFDEYNSSSNKPYKLSIGFGYSVFQSNLYTTFDDLIHEADTMLYQEKEKYKENRTS